MNVMVFVPVGILLPTPFANRPNSFAKDLSHFSFVFPLIRCLYSSILPVSSLYTALTKYGGMALK